MNLPSPRSMPDWATMAEGSDGNDNANSAVSVASRIRWWAASPLVPILGSVAGVADHHGLVALTFDDGPDAQQTAHVLEALAQANARATFFMIVEEAELYPDVVRYVVEAGHEVGLHGINHERLAGRPSSEIVSALRSGRRRLEAVTGESVSWYRPTYGAQDWRLRIGAKRAGMEVAVWSCWGRDWLDDDVESIAARGLRQVSDGGVLLLHDGHLDSDVPPSPRPSHDKGELTSLTLQGISARGLRACTLSELVQGRRVRRVLWLL